MKKKKRIKSANISKSKLEVNFKLILNVLLISVLLLGSIYIFIMANAIDIENKDLLISYTEDSNITYTIYLKENPYYSTQTLGMNQQYPLSLVDKVNIKMNYKFLSSEESNYKYRYFATATLVANNRNNILNNQNNNLLTRTYQLENEITGTNTRTTEYNIEKEYTIDYNYFNTYITNYRNDYNLSLDSYIKITMYVSIIDTYQDNVLNTAKTMEVNIPLLTNPFGITINNPEDINKDIYKESSFTTSNAFFNIFASVMLVTGLVLAVQEFRKVIKSDNEQSKYINKLNKIMLANSEVIVRVTNKINLKNHNIIEVESIEALLDAQNELRIPIAYFETKRNKEGCFVIVNGKEAWRYILKLEDDK